MKKEHFCTCQDYSCKLHPTNHNLGCDPCIKKNLNRGEIPSCFFRKVHDDLSEQTSFTYKDFSDFVIKHSKQENK